MKDHLDFFTYYFTEEKIIGIFIISIGILSLFLALIFLFIIKYSFFKGMAVPLLLIGIIQLVAGSFIYERTPNDISRMEHFYKYERQKIKTEELPRMQKVMDNFALYKWIEISLIVTGLLLFFRFYKSAQSFWKGIGLALMIQVAILLSIDVVAEKRAKEYVKNLTTLSAIPRKT
jgi:hypothetical protein